MITINYTLFDYKKINLTFKTESWKNVNRKESWKIMEFVKK